MPEAEFFGQFGLIAFRNFLERDFCDDLCLEIRNADKELGKSRSIHLPGEVVNEEKRKRKEATNFPINGDQPLAGKLHSVLSDIETQYQVELNDVQPPKYCMYETGDFYGIHIDSGDHKNIAEDAKQRKISAIIFLNEESREPEEGKYCGGNLTFYGLNQNEAFAKFGLPLVGEQGMLITFPPTLPHEVTPVTSGERFTIATWFI